MDILNNIFCFRYHLGLYIMQEPEYQHLSVIQFLNYIGSLIPLLMLTIDTKHSPTYQSNIGVKQRSSILHLSLNLYCFASLFFLLILRVEVAFCKDCTGLLSSTLPLNPYFSLLQCAILAAEKSQMLLSICQS
jgi:hypothetical protein